MTKTWARDDETPLRRYSGNATPYQPHDRYVSASHHDGPRNSARSYTYASPDEQEVEPDSKSSRRRIPVACGRCRKRKIKCSGPIGDASCTNCKNAGSSDCQFNRVSSEELPFRDATVEFNYNPDLARSVHARGCSPSGAYRPNTPAYPVLTQALPYICRPEYYPSRYISMYTGGDFGEDALEYAISNHSYTMCSQDHVGGPSNYGPHPTGRNWTPMPPSGRAYFDAEEPTYPQAQLQYSNVPYGLRTNGNAEPNNFSFSGMANSLPSPAPIITNDRVLPMPAVPRSTTGLAPSRSTDPLSYMGPPLKTYHDHTIQMAGPTANQVGYLALSSSPTTVNNYAVSNGNGIIGPQQQDIFNNAENWAPPPLASDPTLRTLEASSDQYYRHNSESPQKPSQSSKNTGSISQSSPPSANSQRNLYGQETADPPRKGSVDVSHGAIHRRSSGSLHGA